MKKELSEFKELEMNGLCNLTDQLENVDDLWYFVVSSSGAVIVGSTK